VIGFMNTVIVINSERFGVSDNELGEKLIGSFLRKLWANVEKPKTMVFYHTGIKLLTKDSLVLDAIEALSKAGVDLVACGTCAGYYDVRDDILFGRISDMAEIVGIIMGSDKVVTP
jgi:intracellular sulfur oxidation DsrE/DsrF family protein